MLRKVLFCFITLILPGWVNAQALKSHGESLIWTELEADYYLPGQNFLYFRNQYRHITDDAFAGISEKGAFHKFYEVYVLLGYDHKFTKHWRGGISARYTFTPNNDNRIYLAMLQHNGKIGSVDFIKRLAYDFTQYDFGDSRGRLRPRAALEKSFKAGNHTIRPHISYELFIHNDFKPDEEIMPETRTIDRTRWRMGVSYKATPYLWITPYFIKQTDYFIVEPTYIEDGQGNMIEKQPGGRLNRINPIFGLDLRFMFPGRHLTDESVPNLGSLNDGSGN